MNTLAVFVTFLTGFIERCFVLQQQCPPTDLGFNFDANKQQRQLIAELENKNRSTSLFNLIQFSRCGGGD